MGTIENFKPEVIGMDLRRHTEALRAWELYVDALMEVTADITCFLEVDNISTEDLLSLLGENPQSILIRLHQMTGKIPEDFNLEKMVKLGIVSNHYTEYVEASFKQYLISKENAERFFRCNIKLLRNEDGIFDLTDQFKASLKESCTRYTKSEDENQALRALRLIIEGLNHFAVKKVVKPSYGIPGLNPLLRFIKVNVDRSGYEMDLNLFSSERWKSL
jgi:hypothetical protein